MTEKKTTQNCLKNSDKLDWLFAFLRRLRQFDGVEGLFNDLKANLPDVISFSSMKMVVPSFLDKSWVFDSTRETHEAGREKSALVDNVLTGIGTLGRVYFSRATVNLKSAGQSGEAATLAVPLAYEKTWGVLALESDSFSDEGVTLMNILSVNIGIYFEEQSCRSELNIFTQQLQKLHILIRSLLLTHNRDHLMEGMLGYLKSVIPHSACAVYIFEDHSDGNPKMKCLAWYEEENISVPNNELALKCAHSMTSVTESETGIMSRYVSPIFFQSRLVGAVDLYKPSGIAPKELEMYQLLIDYVSSFWVLYDLIVKKEEEASVDHLTGLWNRRYMLNRFQEEAERIARYGGNACVVIGDMGDFKHINDNYGHSKGDEVLAKVAKSIRKCLRFSDCVGRYGGDEFIMLLPNTSKADVNIVLGRINAELGLLRIASGKDAIIDVVLDFGVAAFPDEAPTFMDAINLADDCMYAKKNARKIPAR